MSQIETDFRYLKQKHELGEISTKTTFAGCALLLAPFVLHAAKLDQNLDPALTS